MMSKTRIFKVAGGSNPLTPTTVFKSQITARYLALSHCAMAVRVFPFLAQGCRKRRGRVCWMNRHLRSIVPLVVPAEKLIL
jgi:hypothetical protein